MISELEDMKWTIIVNSDLNLYKSWPHCAARWSQGIAGGVWTIGAIDDDFEKRKDLRVH